MTNESGGNAPFFDPIFDNFNDSKKTVDEKLNSDVLNLNEVLINGLESTLQLLWGEYFNEIEAAKFLRLPDPEGRGKNTIKN